MGKANNTNATKAAAPSFHSGKKSFATGLAMWVVGALVTFNVITPDLADQVYPYVLGAAILAIRAAIGKLQR